MKHVDRALLLAAVHVAVPMALVLVACDLGPDPSVAQPRRQRLVGSLGSLMYTCVGVLNLLMIRSDKALTRPTMAYTNAVMGWSALFFGPVQIYFDLKYGYALRPLDYSQWITLPNFAWGVEWGLQLLESPERGSGWRALGLAFLSLGSYALKPLYGDVGFLVAILPQVLVCVVVCGYCYSRFKSPGAARMLILMVVGCVGFLLLHDPDAVLPKEVTGWANFQDARAFAMKICDCTQIHCSIRFFCAMFHTKGAREAASLVQVAPTPCGPGTATCSPAPMNGFTVGPCVVEGNVSPVTSFDSLPAPPL